MSGGVEESFELTPLRTSEVDTETFWIVLMHAREKKSVVCCNLNDEGDEEEMQLPNGLVKNHAYIVSSLAMVSLEGKELRLVKCVNPWGNDVEWRHDWSRKSELWNKIDSKIRRNLLNEVKNSGQFW
jgi:hypothetical protein